MSTDVKVLSNEFLKSIMTDTVSEKGWCQDINTATAAGVYSVTYPCENLPMGAYDYGTLAVFNGGNYCFQLYVTDRSNINGEYLIIPQIYFRAFAGNIFTKWVHVSSETLT